MGLAKMTQSHGWKNFMAKLYGWGASVVIVGALFKIMHWPFAGWFLIAGLGTEAIIFFFSAFEPLHEEVDWSLVYPQLSGIQDEDDFENMELPTTGTHVSGGGALSKFDQMLEKAGGEDLFEKVGTGLENLNQRVSELGSISDAAVATNDFTKNVNHASESVQELSSAYKESVAGYKQSAESLNYSTETLSDAFNKNAQVVAEKSNNFSSAYDKLASSMDIDFSVLKTGNSEYSSQMSSLNKNLEALNAIFELQVNEADLDQMMADLTGSVEHSRKYHAEIKKLGQRLESLNNVYGNMLAAMNVKVN